MRRFTMSMIAITFATAAAVAWAGGIETGNATSATSRTDACERAIADAEYKLKSRFARYQVTEKKCDCSQEELTKHWRCIGWVKWENE